MTVVAAMMLAEVVMAHHHDHKMTALEFVIFGTISVLSLAVVLGALCWWLALRPSVSVAIMLWGQLVPLFPTFQACARYQLFNLALKRFDARNQHHELATPSRRSSRSTHSPPPQLPSLRNSHQSERGWRPSGWDWPSLRERSSDPAERELAERGGRHSRRASLASGRSPRHQDTDSSVDSAEDVFPYDQHPPHPRAPSTPSAPHSVHSSHRRVPSNESLPDHDIFDLPRRSTASNITRAQPFDATAPHQIHHAARPSHSAPLHAADLPSSWHHDSSAPF
ncbi:hypothetical protein BCR35DRAFT_302894 [Leucosporidium creatinivorum]|uniref:Transmembrane protein n=1 Tax=Leucosporidium creatinivorum TaxID=106004 RepID=A0A1Y2FN73_9BASI|nr:hypothetical protein BCR35DRAFT_302894 [Leucosporidium creatinivorum]